ncbi:hypothetical protein K7432_013587 [Basidiobolus ranarum]|uniref:Calcineurin-like phosphoesterase domain-containing protein n=1 Tax=Basidiobolus ranarum TaxID=34480 RepID=A0ABR2WJ29_9FUNG
MRLLFTTLLFFATILHTLAISTLLQKDRPRRVSKKLKIQPSDETPTPIQELHLPSTNRRLIIIGDVHGSLEPFEKLLEKLNYNSEYDHLVLTGDIIGKGSHSIETLQKAKDIGASCVRGNHDNLLLEWKHFLFKLSNSNITTKDQAFPSDFKPKSPYYTLARNLDEELYNYLNSCPYILSVPQHSLYILHAGIDPSFSIHKQDPNVVMNVKNILPDGSPSRNNKLGKHWSVLWNLKQEMLGRNATTIVYGHQASRGLNIKPYSIGLDTGCVYGRHLTSMAFPGNKLLSVNCKRNTRKSLTFLPAVNDF